MTVGQFRKFVEATGNQTDAEKQGWAVAKTESGWEKVNGASWRKPGFSQTDDHPVVDVSWNDALAFCQWAGCRLPTEAEWEYSARERGKKVRFGNGKNIADPAEINFYGGSAYKTAYSVVGVYRAKTVPVASFMPNALGLYDMSGNVWEWCSDWYDENYYKNAPQNNPKGPASSPYGARVLRGGSWDVVPRLARSAVRLRIYPGNRSDNVGFRVVQDSPH